MNTVKIRNIEIGSGLPKICAPIVGTTKEDIMAEAENIGRLPVDIAEWRVDWFEHAFNFSKVERRTEGFKNSPWRDSAVNDISHIE